MGRSRSVAILAVVVVLTACGGDGGSIVPPSEALTSFERAAVEEAVGDAAADLLWVASGTTGGAFPHLAYAYGLFGVAAGTFAAVTVDPSFEPGFFDPYCSPSTVEGVRRCGFELDELRDLGIADIYKLIVARKPAG